MKKNNPLHVKINSGKFKGKKLLLPSLDNTRSTKSIVKSAYFNTIQFGIIDKIFIEAFGGSGSMGLEALSRGSKRAYFIEKNKNAFKILEQNCKICDYENSICIFGDTFIELPKIVNNIRDSIFLYMDPPFNFRNGMNDIYNQCFELLQNLSKEKIVNIAFEHFSNIMMPDKIGNFQLIKTKVFGNSSISYYR